MSEKKFCVELLADSLKALSFIDFAFLFGSSSDGIIRGSSDVDIAVYFSRDYTVDFDLASSVLKSIDNVVPTSKVDLVRLNVAGVVLCFEVLKGKCLFVRENCLDIYSEFYSQTCRDYEDYIFWMSKQLEYRGIRQ